MENKIGYAYISLEEYKELIEDKVKLNIIYDEIVLEKENIEEEYKNIEQKILEKIYQSERYYLKNYDGLGEYHHNELVKSFQNYGYTSSDKINKLIKVLVERYNEDERSDK